MRWCTILKRINQEAKLSLGTLWSEAKNLEHLFLQLAIVDTEATATNFHTVAHEVVSHGTHLLWVLVEQWNIIRIWQGEWVVGCHQTLFLIAPFKEREVNNPKALEGVFVAQTKTVAHLQTQGAKLSASLVCLFATENQHEVAVICAHRCLHFCEVFRSVELINAALHCAVFVILYIYQTLSTHLWTLHEVGELVKLFAGVVGATWHANTANVFCTVKHCELALLEHVHQFHKFHTETQVRLVATVAAHGIVPSHLFKFWNFHATDFLKQVASHRFKHFKHVFLIHETHFAVDLSKLRLTVGTQVLVAEALRNLEIAVETCHHQQLLQGLRALRQCVELTGVHA